MSSKLPGTVSRIWCSDPAYKRATEEVFKRLQRWRPFPTLADTIHAPYPPPTSLMWGLSSQVQAPSKLFVQSWSFIKIMVSKIIFLKWTAGLFYFVCRNATLELTVDNRIRSSKSKHSNVRHTAFNNLALSVEQDGQALSEVSSFAESLRSQPGELHVSVASHTTAAGVGFIK